MIPLLDKCEILFVDGGDSLCDERPSGRAFWNCISFKAFLYVDVPYHFQSSDQTAMELEYKEHLEADFEIVFNALYTLYNNPMGRFGAFLRRSRNLSGYMKKLYDAFNLATVEALMCRFQISVDYDGKLYDCDFNLAAGLPIFSKETIADWIGKPYTARKIRMDKHCYACTAGAGSS